MEKVIEMPRHRNLFEEYPLTCLYFFLALMTVVVPLWSR